MFVVLCTKQNLEAGYAKQVNVRYFFITQFCIFRYSRYFYILHYDLSLLFMDTMSRQSANGSPQNMPPVVTPLALSPSKMVCYNKAWIGKTVLSFYIPATTPPLKDSRYSPSYEHTSTPAAKSPCYTPIRSRASTLRTEIGSPSSQYSQEFCSSSASLTSAKWSGPIYQLMNNAAYEEFRKKHFPLFHAKYVVVLWFNISN